MSRTMSHRDFIKRIAHLSHLHKLGLITSKEFVDVTREDLRKVHVS